ncbi:hypothetical protein FOCC_FOCC007580 [Frankliniella occidentalis]|nr:hypothetical protein FOCC_FOCC007580 [Frankliniella occidentalis]
MLTRSRGEENLSHGLCAEDHHEDHHENHPKGDPKGDLEGDSKGDPEGDSKGDPNGDPKSDPQSDPKGQSSNGFANELQKPKTLFYRIKKGAYVLPTVCTVATGQHGYKQAATINHFNGEIEKKRSAKLALPTHTDHFLANAAETNRKTSVVGVGEGERAHESEGEKEDTVYKERKDS